jgi:hypothetical protein
MPNPPRNLLVVIISTILAVNSVHAETPGGQYNSVSGSYNIIVGGSYNSMNQTGKVIVGGYDNREVGSYSVMLGGQYSVFAPLFGVVQGTMTS